MEHANPFKKKRKSKHLKTLIAATSVLAAVFAIVFFFVSRQKAGVLILDTDTALQITINGRTVETELQENGSFINLYAGKYRLQVIKPGYQPFQEDILVTKGSTLSITPSYSLAPSLAGQSGKSIDYVQPSQDQKYIYYLSDYRQRLYRMDIENQVATPLTDKPLSSVTNVEWSQNPNLALITQTDGVYLHEIPRFDFENQIFIKVAGSEFLSPVWDPQNEGRLAAALFADNGERSLIVTDKRFQKVDRLTFLDGIPTPKISWSPTGDMILIQGRSSELFEQNLWVYTLANGDLQQIVNTGGVKNARFNPDGSKIIYESRAVSGETRLSTIDPTGENNTPLSWYAPMERIAWKDATSLYEVNIEKNLLITRILGGGATQTAVSLPAAKEIENVLYFKDKGRLVVSTDSAVFTVTTR